MYPDSTVGQMISSENDDYDSGVPTDSELKTPEKKHFSHKEHVSDYETGCSSPNTSKVSSDEESSGDINSQVTLMDSRQGVDETTRNKDIASQKLEDVPHTVTCTITISFAIPGLPKKEDLELGSTHKGKKGHKHQKKVIEAPKAQKYFHFEYVLLPEFTEPTKVDVVMFGVVAKLYMDHESRLIKPWQEGDKIWLSWSHSIDLQVTKEALMKALSHQIQVKIWDTKDKVSAKARFDRPKAFRVSHVKHGEESEVKQSVMNQRKLFEDSLPKTSFILEKNGSVVFQENLCAQEPKCVMIEKSQRVRFPMPSSSSIVLENPVKRSELSNIGLSAITLSEKLPAAFNERSKSAGSQTDVKADLQKLHLNTQSLKDLKTDVSSSKVVKPQFTEMLEKTPSIRSVQMDRKCLTFGISFMPLLAGDLAVTGRIQESSDKILDCYMTLGINSPLLSQQQTQELNPLIIRILSATSLPATPTPISVLQEKCVPVYCRYRFRDQSYHQTHGQTHGTHVFFRDVFVIFAGTISVGELRESLLGPPVEIEVHDRDRRIEESVSKPSLFGMEPEDEKLSNVGLVTSKRTVHNPFTKSNRQWDPYGVARLSLSELVYGATYLNISVPIHSCECPDPTGYQSDCKNGNILGVIGSVDGPQDSPLPVGYYLDAQSHLKVRVDLAVPLSFDEESPDCPFGRMVCIFEYRNKQLFRDFIINIANINSKALGLDFNPWNVTVEALSRVSLTENQKRDVTLDVITSIHIMDGSIHLFILEGLKDKGIKELWETLSSRPKGENEKLETLYNSEMAFCERLYKDLGVLLCHIHLLENLTSLVNQPLLYVRDMVPPLCFHALSRLDYIRSAKKLRDVIHSNLLPSADMIHVLSREFGIPFNFGDLLADTEPSPSKKLVISELEDKWYSKHLLHNTLDNNNEAYIQWKCEMERQEIKDHIKGNIEHVYQLSRKVRRPKVEYVEIVPMDGMAVHNYSSHTFNSMELAYRILRQKMAEDPNHRYTYSADFQSATVSPGNIQEELKNNSAKSREEWMTPIGFVYPGFKNSIDCNRHPKRPHDSRILELTKAWKENILHANTLQPTLSRDRWSWAKRNIDFNLYRKPPERCSVLDSGPIHLTDDNFKEEQKAAQSPTEYKQKMKFYRCLPQTELTSQGPQASNQIAKLQGLLKDKEAKVALRKPGLALKPIPALAVMPNSEEHISRGFIPGELKDHSLKWRDNIIPRHHMEHETLQQLRGKDFDLLSTSHSFLHKRRIEEITQEEKNSYVVRKSDPQNRGFHVTKMAEDSQNIIQIQSHEGFLLHIQ
ncbi:uncharacterized protein CFAP92 [Aquarana catesbeiana]